MASVMALVSKGEFERDHGSAAAGTTCPFKSYTSTNKALEPLAAGGDLYLVTVRPGEALWLVAVLRGPRHIKGVWTAAANTVPVADARPLIGKLRFVSGKGMSAEPGKLAMSLQTPRALTDDDVELLEALAAGTAPTSSAATKPTAAAAKPTAAKPTAAAKPTTPEQPPAATKPTAKPTAAKLQAATVSSKANAASASTATASGRAVGTPWATPPDRPAAVPAGANYDAIDDRWVLGTCEADGTRQGPWKEYRADGSLYVDTAYLDGVLDGTQREYHPDGTLLSEARWVRGVQKESYKLRSTKEPVEAMWAGVDPRVVRVESIPDESGHGWRTGILRDAAGVEVTPQGEPVPPRPAGVPTTARLFVGEGPPAWVDVVQQYMTLAPLGLKRVWSAAGDPLRETEYTPHGRKIWHREAIDPDPNVALVDNFFADPVEFKPSYELRIHWTLARHTEVRARLRTSSSRHVAAYLKVLGKVEWAFRMLAPDGLTACGLEVAGDWLARKPEARGDDGAAKILWWLLEKRIERHDRAEVAALIAPARAVFPKDAGHKELLTTAEALASGATDKALDKVAAAPRAELTEEDLLRLAQRVLHRSGLRIYLGDATRGDVLLLDEPGRPYLFDGTRFEPAPLVIETSDKMNAVHFQDVDVFDERRLFMSGEHVWWSLARCGRMLQLQGSRYYSDRGQGEVVLSALVRCPDRTWVERVTTMFRATMPSGAKEVDPFYDAGKGWLFAREYRSTHGEPHGSALSRAVDGTAIMSCSGSPGVLRLEMKDKEKGKGPRTLSQHASAEEARERCARFELQLLRTGYTFQRVVALPVGPRGDAPPPKAKPVAKPPAAVTLAVAERVSAELRRAATAKTLTAKLAALRDAWNQRPAVSLARALDALAATAPARPELAGKTKPAIAKWDELAETPDAAALGPLLATLTDVPSTIVQPRLEQLATWPPDPRYDQTLVAIATEIPFTSSGTQSVWRRIFARLAASQDARILEPLRALPGIYGKKWKTVTGAWATEQIEKILATRTSTLEALAALTLHPDDQAALDAIAVPSAPATSPTGPDALLAAIFAAPDDPAPRLAYAAHMQDVRAEHITLSARGDALDKSGRARLAELEREHIAELAGPLAKWIKKGAKVRHGFLVRAAKTGGDLPPELAASPWWSTVEDLDVATDRGLLASPSLRSLKVLRGVSVELAPRYKDFPTGHAKVAELVARPLVTTLEVGVEGAATIKAVLEAGAFPALTELTVTVDRGTAVDVRWLDEPAAKQLVRFTLVQDVGSTTTYLEAKGTRAEHDRTGVTWLAELWRVARTESPALAELGGVFQYGSNVSLKIERREGDGCELSVKSGSRLYGWNTVLADNVAFLIDALAPVGLRHARFDLTGTPPDVVTAINEAARLAGITAEWRAKGS